MKPRLNSTEHPIRVVSGMNSLFISLVFVFRFRFSTHFQIPNQKKDYYLVTANAPIIIAMMTDAPKTNGAILMRENAVPEVSVIPSMIGAQAVSTSGKAPSTDP